MMFALKLTQQNEKNEKTKKQKNILNKENLEQTIVFDNNNLKSK
jgi:hypothetical protein